MDGAISSASDSVVLMTKRIIKQPPVLSSRPPGSSEPLSSAASKLNAGPGVEGMTADEERMVLKTPGQVGADLEAESTGQQYMRSALRSPSVCTGRFQDDTERHHFRDTPCAR